MTWATVPTITLTDGDGTNQIARMRQNNGNLDFLSRNNTANGTIRFYGTDASTDTLTLTISAAGNVTPGADDDQQLGSAGLAWSNVTAHAFTPKAITVASLPAAASSTDQIRVVTDATGFGRRATVAGGGANRVAVISDGTNWIIL